MRICILQNKLVGPKFRIKLLVDRDLEDRFVQNPIHKYYYSCCNVRTPCPM